MDKRVEEGTPETATENVMLTHDLSNADDISMDTKDDELSDVGSDSSNFKPKVQLKLRKLWKKSKKSGKSYNITKRSRKIKEQVESKDQVSFDAIRKQFVCKFCDKGFSTKDRHARHVRCHENPDNLQKCLYCDYKTVEKYVLIQHLASKHHVDRDGNELKRDIKCSDCSFTCVSNFQLKNHMLQKHSSKQFKCDECGHLFGKKALRDRHILAKHRNERPHLCETCGHRAKTLNAFKSHLELHSGKKFVCDICGLALTLSCSLKRHMKLHISNEKPFPCHLCSFATRKRYNLRVHLRNVHKLEMDSTGNVVNKVQVITQTSITQSLVPDSPNNNHPIIDNAMCISQLESIAHIF
ncbi:hypothetical protein CHUAL_002039 [Chamberlinius hualienensis]